LSTNRKLTKNSVELEINLRKLLGEAAPKDQEFRDAVTQKAIDLILDRTSEGRSWKGHKFKRYSDRYKKSDDFKAAGKTDIVNLTLSGDMLGLLDEKRQTRDKVVLGWEDETQNAKAFNHIKGDTVPSRDFFDLNKKEQTELKKFAKDYLKDDS